MTNVAIRKYRLNSPKLKLGNLTGVKVILELLSWGLGKEEPDQGERQADSLRRGSGWVPEEPVGSVYRT